MPKKARNIYVDEKEKFLEQHLEYNEDRANREGKKAYHGEKRNRYLSGALFNALESALVFTALLKFPTETQQFISTHLPESMVKFGDFFSWYAAIGYGADAITKGLLGIREVHEVSLIRARAGKKSSYDNEGTRAKLRERVKKDVDYIGELPENTTSYKNDMIDRLTTKQWNMRVDREPAYQKLEGEMIAVRKRWRSLPNVLGLNPNELITKEDDLRIASRELAKVDMAKESTAIYWLAFRATQLLQGRDPINLERRRKQIRNNWSYGFVPGPHPYENTQGHYQSGINHELPSTK